MKRFKEFGSNFHSPLDCSIANMEVEAFSGKFSLFFSGRAALYNIVDKGISSKGWKKLYLPSFYCHEVAQFIKLLHIQCIYYEYNPFVPASNLNEVSFDDSESSVIVNVYYYGLKMLDLSHLKNAVIIDDITHKLLYYKESTADYCFASLRKELPVPVGGVCFSPKKNDLPVASPSLKAEEIALVKLSAMFLKQEHIKGVLPNVKPLFLKLFEVSEDDFSLTTTNVGMPELAKAILNRLNVDEIIEAKYKNIEFALSLLSGINSIEINFNTKNKDSFGLILLCKTSKEKDGLKKFLVNNNIFPATLWPHQIFKADQEIEQRMLFLHMDYRYNFDDILFVTNKIKDYFNYE